MIITASRRTDIPAFYSEWLMGRLHEGYALVPNPRNPGRLSRVELSPDHVDCIVFWTKNPIPMLDKLAQLDAMGYAHYTQFTLTPYDKTVESSLPPKKELLQAFIEMSRCTSPKQAVWRYDPVFIDTRHSVECHIERFAEMCETLCGYTERCFLSFVDAYKSISDRYRAMTQAEMVAIAKGFSEIARKHQIELFTCAEEIDLTRYGVRQGACVDMVSRRMAAHDPHSPVITGWPKGDEIITSRTRPSFKVNQTSLLRYSPYGTVASCSVCQFGRMNWQSANGAIRPCTV